MKPIKATSIAFSKWTQKQQMYSKNLNWIMEKGELLKIKFA